MGSGPWWGEETLPASCALMPVLYSAGLMIALYPPLACSPPALSLPFVFDAICCQFEQLLERGRGECEGLGSNRCLTIAPKTRRPLPRGCCSAAGSWGGQGLDLAEGPGQSTARAEVPERGVLPSAMGRKGGVSPPVREGNPSLSEAGQFVLRTSVTFHM